MARLLVFDSGIGGLSVLRQIRLAGPPAEIAYVADDAAFPYGGWAEEDLTRHVVAVVGDLIARHRPSLVVIACNTASTLVLQPLREAHPGLPFVGTVPAIKPAAERSRSRRISVLATPGTIARDYTRGLIAAFAADCDIALVGSARLAPLAEAHLRGGSIRDEEVAAEIAPAFVDRDGRRTDTVVLACTHYPFLQPFFERLAPWPVEWIDPAPAIARRVASLLPAGSAATAAAGAAWLTSGRPWPDVLRPLLASHGLDAGHSSGVQAGPQRIGAPLPAGS